MRVLLALGGNAMTGPDGSATPAAQIEARRRRDAGRRRAGRRRPRARHHPRQRPQVGNILVKNELAAHVVPPVPLDWCGAQTQGDARLHHPQRPRPALADAGARPPVAALVTRTLVDRDDPGFTHPSKPIGRYLPREQAQTLIDHGQVWEDRGEKGWRRVVASPEPLEVLDVGPVRALLEAGYVVVAAGGGGIPVVREPDGRLRGVEAVIDKDLTAALLARTLEADVLVIATDVDHAASTGAPRSSATLGRVTLAELRRYAADGQFAVGVDGPQGRRRHPVRRRRRPAQRHHPLTHITDAVEGSASAPSSRPPSTRPKEPHRARRHRGPQGPAAHRVRRLRARPSSSTTGVLEADRVIAVIGKTEGNGGVNDYTRIIADRAFREILVDEGRRPGRRSRRCRSCGPAAPTA